MKPEKQAEAILKEYELCQDYAKHLDTNIWTTSGLIGLGSIGSLLLSNYSSTSLPVIIIVGLLVICIVWIWWKMANRWWDIQHVTFMRMRHIESTLHLYRNRYIKYLDSRLGRRDLEVISDLPDKEKKDLKGKFTQFYKGQVRGVMKWLPRAITIIWLSYVVIAIIKKRKDLVMQVIGSVSITWFGLLIVLLSVFIGGVGIGLIISVIFGRKFYLTKQERNQQDSQTN